MKRVLVMGVAIAAGSAGVIGGYLLLVPREYQPCAACGATGARSCGASGCVNGRVSCTGDCLRRENPNWQYSTNPHFPPGTLTLRFWNEDGSALEVSQAHVGQTLTQVNGRWTLGAACARCQGTTRMVCPSCGGKLACPTCRGKGEVAK